MIGYVNETQDKYIMQFLNLTPKLYILTKLTKDLLTWYHCVVHLKYKNLLWMANYILDIEKISSPTPNKIYGCCMIY